MRRVPRRHVLLAIAVAAAWGFNFVVIEWGLQGAPPLLLCAMRFTLAAIPVLFLPRPDVPWRLLIGIGLTLGVVKFGLLFTAMDVGINAGLASLVLQCQVLFTVLLAAVVLGERLKPKTLAGLALGVIGFVIIGSERGGSLTALGLGLAIAAGAAWAVANMMMKRASAAEPVALIAWMSLIPPLPLLALSMLTEDPSLSDLGGRALPAALYIAVVATLGGFAAWSWLMRTYDAGQVASFALLVPVFGLSFGALLLGEQFTLAHLAGSVLVLAGLAAIVVSAPVQQARGDDASDGAEEVALPRHAGRRHESEQQRRPVYGEHDQRTGKVQGAAGVDPPHHQIGREPEHEPARSDVHGVVGAGEPRPQPAH
jgi:O-acetylserine/cysteine efflux transporter